MEPSTAGQPPVTGPRRADADASVQDRPPQIRSLITPGVASSPVLPEWLRKRFRRKDTPAAR